MTTEFDCKLERLVKTIQRKLDGNPIILVGSGASIPYGLPSMNELAAEIIKRLDLKFTHENTWNEFKTKMLTTNNFEDALEKINITEEIHNAIIVTTWSLIHEKDEEAFKFFIKSNTFPVLTLLIRKFVQRAGATNIITTNYDRLIEYSVDFAEGNLEAGFIGNYYRSFGYFQTSSAKRKINLFKVHGSIDWFKHRTKHKIMATNSMEEDLLKDIYVPMIVTPGNGKYRETHNDPFRTVIAEADKALRNSTSYLCIGYGFNDEHIQPIIIDENRNKNKPIVVVTKSITSKMDELFLKNESCNCIIISEETGGGTKVHYNKHEKENFTEDYWCLDQFYKLWFE